MDKAQENFEKVLNSPNINTKALSQIHKSEKVIQAQLNQLRSLNKQTESTTARCSKLTSRTLQRTGQALDYERIQRFAEDCDRTLRVLENTVKIVEDNEELKYRSS